MATDLARKIVCQWGMSEELGMVEYGDHQEHTFLARDMTGGRSYSEDTAQKIDHEVKRFIDNAYKRAKDLLMEHRDALDIIAQALLDFETLDGKQIRELIHDGEMKEPPSDPEPPEIPEEKIEQPSVSDDSKRAGDELPPGDLAPAGA